MFRANVRRHGALLGTVERAFRAVEVAGVPSRAELLALRDRLIDYPRRAIWSPSTA